MWRMKSLSPDDSVTKNQDNCLKNMKALHFSLSAPNSLKPASTHVKEPPSPVLSQTQIAFYQYKHPLVIKCSKSSNNSNSNGSGGDDEAAQPPRLRAVVEGVELRFRRGSRRRMRQDGFGDGQQAKKAAVTASASGVEKKWEEMTVMEKAMEVYVGEKGLLFWLNKFAYASIFIVIGAWILFRFVGPSLNLYQLETPPLAPSNVFKG